MLDMYYDSLKLQVRDNTQQVVRSMIVWFISAETSYKLGGYYPANTMATCMAYVIKLKIQFITHTTN